jgi:hypothetical protein
MSRTGVAVAGAETGHGERHSTPGPQGLDDGAFAPFRDRHRGGDTPDLGQAVDMPVAGLAAPRVRWSWLVGQADGLVKVYSDV